MLEEANGRRLSWPTMTTAGTAIHGWEGGYVRIGVVVVVVPS
jgi:hypothetical protein